MMKMSQVRKGISDDRVADFYEGKSVFMTGASGYLGAVMLETLLRCCPGIRSIFILLREKKGVQPECRKETIFKRNIFEHLKKNNPDVLNKVHVVAGNISLPDMGMSQHDLINITGEVSIVFHVAACISFLKPLSYILTQNSMPMDYVIDLCRKLKKIDVLVYTSSAYSNSNRKEFEIEEQIYRLPFPAQRFLQELKNGNDDSVNDLAAQCLPKWPNTYTFSKCLAENVILDKAADIPSVIVRPSVIGSCWKGILPGYVEEGSGIVDIGIAIGKGFLRVISGDPEVQIDIIPADIVANTHIVAAWLVATSRSSSPLVVNCTSNDTCDTSLKKYTNSLLDLARRNPLPKAFQKPGQSMVIQKNFLLYALFSLIEHYVPACFSDALLSVRGGKPRLVSLYRFFDKQIASFQPFIFNEYKFLNHNFNGIDKQLREEDKEVFYTDLNGFTVEDLTEQIPIGAPYYKWKLDRKGIVRRKRAIEMRYIFTTSIKVVFMTTIFSLLYFIFSQALKIIYL